MHRSKYCRNQTKIKLNGPLLFFAQNPAKLKL